MAYPPEVIRQIQNLLAEHVWNSAAIASMVGVSQTTVENVSKGRRTLQTKAIGRKVGEVFQPSRYATARFYTRCRECGGMVKMPCMRCGENKRRKTAALLQRPTLD